MMDSENTLNACRHFLGLYPDKRASCKIGRDVRAWAVRCNGGNSKGIGLGIPCSKQREGRENLFSCPELCRKTNQEVEAGHAEMRFQMQKFVTNLHVFEGHKKKMVKKGLTVAKAHCPWCEGKNTLILNCNIHGNKHMRAKCTSCDKGFIE